MFFDFLNPISDTLKNLLEQENPPLKDVINDESCIKTLQKNNARLVEFLSEHAEDLLRLSLSFDDPDLSAKSFSLITASSDKFMRTLVDQGILEAVANSLLEIPSDTDPVLINRLAVITLTALTKLGDVPIQKYPYYTKFLDFLHLRSIYDLFTTILDTDDTAQMIQTWLANDHFVDTFINSLRDIPDELDTDQANRATAMYKLIPLLVRSEAMCPIIQTPEAVQVILRTFAAPPVHLLNAKFNAIPTVLIASTAPLTIEHFQEFVALFCEDHPLLYAYQVYILSIFQVLLTLDDKFSEMLKEAGIVKHMIEKLEKYPKHTFYHRACHKLIMSSLSQPDFGPEVVTAILPFCSQCVQETGVELRSFAWNLIEEIKGSGFTQAVNALSDIDPEVSDALDAIDQYVKKGYSGPKPAPQEPSGLGGLGSLSPDQLMLLFQLLSQRQS